MTQDRHTGYIAIAGALFLAPILHPLLIPLVGVPSHLLWFVHVVPVAVLTYGYGRRGAVVAVAVSAAMVVAGERVFGAGYFEAATWETAMSLGVSLTFTNVLLAGFALYARRITARYQLLFDGSTTGIIRTTESGRITTANPVARDLLQRPDGALHGERILDVLGIEEVDGMEDLEELGGWTGPVELQGSGPDRTAHLLVTALRSETVAEQGYQVLLVDRSTEVMQQKEIERTVRLATLGEALAGVAHEVKNPLTAIRGFADMGASEELPPDEARDMFQTIHDQADRMTALVQELLGYSRPQPAVERTAIHELVPRITRVQRIALGKGVKLVDRIEWEGELAASAGKVEQIIQNLISNAVDAADGDVTITVGVREVDDGVAIEVADDGPGVPGAVLDRIFRPFFTTKPEGEGTGLGLAISRRLALAMGGDLEARNLKPRGAAFTLTLPKAGPSDGREQAPAGAGEPTRSGELESADPEVRVGPEPRSEAAV